MRLLWCFLRACCVNDSLLLASLFLLPLGSFVGFLMESNRSGTLASFCFACGFGKMKNRAESGATQRAIVL